MHKSIITISIFTLIYVSVALATPTVPSTVNIQIKEYGIYQGDVVDKIKNDNPMGYRITSKKNDIVFSTNKIPAKIGTRFGFKYIISGKTLESYINIIRVIKTPRITNPTNGKTTNIFTDEIKVPIGKISFSGYMFEYEWELMPGEYSIQLYLGEKLLAEKIFHVYKP